MFKFNNNHIFTGYLKQLLAAFNLPKYRVYTAEQQRYANEALQKSHSADLAIAKLSREQQQLTRPIAEITKLLETTVDPEYFQMLQEMLDTYKLEATRIEDEISSIRQQVSNTPKELNVLETVYHSKYDTYPNSLAEVEEYSAKMRYVPYIKDGRIQEYTNGHWQDSHIGFSAPHKEFHGVANLTFPTIYYSYGQKIKNSTKQLKIQNTVYDSYTHEYLGDYLRFHRDFANINLMPLYNCFSNRACPHLDLNFEVGNGYNAIFKTDQAFETALYKYYMVPVKFFKDYTIAIDSGASIEMCCCIYDEYLSKDKDFTDIPRLTYQCFSDLQFKTPVLYTKLRNLNTLLLSADPSNLSDLCQQEDNLKLILKIPVNNKSSIVILEGDYTSYNDSIARPTYTSKTSVVYDPISGQSTTKEEQHPHSFLMERNQTIINYENLEACEYLADKLITPLQLLRTNTGESYPFADRLIEYLVGNAITLNETIVDNIVRAKTVISKNCPTNIYPMTPEDGIWEPLMQCRIYDQMHTKYNFNDINHDILGFVDKDVEKWYTSKTKKSAAMTIANIDIYND